MSFTLSANGTRDEVVQALENQDPSDSLGQDVREILIDYLLDATDSMIIDGTPVRYDVTASGHSGLNELLTLSVQVKVI